MVGIDATSDAAKVVDLKTVTDRADMMFITITMNQSPRAVNAYCAVAVMAQTSFPNPTAGIRLWRSKQPETFLYRNVSQTLHRLFP
jgi:hypothetical protein